MLSVLCNSKCVCVIQKNIIFIFVHNQLLRSRAHKARESFTAFYEKKGFIRMWRRRVIWSLLVALLLLQLRVECISVQSRVDPDTKVLLNDQFTISCEIRRVPANRNIFAVRLQCPWSVGFENCYENCRATCLQQECSPDASCLKEEFHEIGGSPELADFTYKYTFKNAQQRHNGTFVCRFVTQMASVQITIQSEIERQLVTTQSTTITTKPLPTKSTGSNLASEPKSSHIQTTIAVPKLTTIDVEVKSRSKNETREKVSAIPDIRLSSVKILGIEINDFIFGGVIILLTIITMCAVFFIRCALVKHYKGREHEAKCPGLLCIKQNSSSRSPISNSYSYNDGGKLRYPTNLGAVRDIENRYYSELKSAEPHPVYESVATSESSGSSIRDATFISCKPDVVVGPFLSSVQIRRNSALLRNNRGSAIVEVALPRYQSLLQMEQQLLGFIQNPDDRLLIENRFLTPQPKRLSRRRQRRSGGSQRSVRSLGNNVSSTEPRHRSVEEVYNISSNMSDT